MDRLALSASGQVRYTLKTPWRDGTTHVVLDPLDFIARLAGGFSASRSTRAHIALDERGAGEDDGF